MSRIDEPVRGCGEGLEVKNRSLTPDLPSAFLTVLAVYLPMRIYLLTMPDGVTSGDAGDFIVAAANFGVPHPSGYPLFTLLGALFIRLLPFLSPAHAVGLIPILATVLTIFIGLKILDLLKVRRWISVALLLCYSFTVEGWVQARIVEVYSLHLCFVALVFYYWVRWYFFRNDREILLSCLVLGFSFTNHLTTMLLLPSQTVIIVIHILNRYGARSTFSFLSSCLCLLILPNLLYLYLPLTALMPSSTKICWNEPKTWPNFIDQLFGVEYIRVFMSDEPISILRRLLGFFRYQSDQFFFPGSFLALIGGLDLIFRRRLLFVILGGYYLVVLSYTCFYQINDIQGYYLPQLLIWAIIGAVGMEWLLRVRLPLAMRRSRYIIAAIALLLYSYPCILLYSNFFVTKVGNRAESISTIAWNQLPENSIILSDKADTIFPLWYRAYVTDKLKNRHVIAANFLAARTWYRDFIRRSIPGIDLPDERTLNGRKLALYKELIIPNQKKFRFFCDLQDRPYHPDWSYLNRGAIAEIIPREKLAQERQIPSNLIDIQYSAHGVQVNTAKGTKWIFYEVPSRFKIGETGYCVVQWQKRIVHRTEWRWYDQKGRLHFAEIKDITPLDTLSYSTIRFDERHAGAIGTWQIEVYNDGRLEGLSSFILDH